MNLDDVATECRLRQASRAHFIGGMSPQNGRSDLIDKTPGNSQVPAPWSLALALAGSAVHFIVLDMWRAKRKGGSLGQRLSWLKLGGMTRERPHL